jgi:hypothetical protein
LLSLSSKIKPVRFLFTTTGVLKRRLRDATETEVAFDRFLVAKLSGFKPDPLLGKLMKGLNGSAKPPSGNGACGIPMQGIG